MGSIFTSFRFAAWRMAKMYEFGRWHFSPSLVQQLGQLHSTQLFWVILLVYWSIRQLSRFSFARRSLNSLCTFSLLSTIFSTAGSLPPFGNKSKKISSGRSSTVSETFNSPSRQRGRPSCLCPHHKTFPLKKMTKFSAFLWFALFLS